MGTNNTLEFHKHGTGCLLFISLLLYSTPTRTATLFGRFLRCGPPRKKNAELFAFLQEKNAELFAFLQGYAKFFHTQSFTSSFRVQNIMNKQKGMCR